MRSMRVVAGGMDMPQGSNSAAAACRRVGVLGIFHETNTFSEIAASYAAFDGTSIEAPGGKITRGKEILEEYRLLTIC